MVFMEIAPEVTLMVVDPTASGVTMPVAVTVATDVSDELQETRALTLLVE